MRTRRLLPLVVVAVILVGATYWLNHGTRTSASAVTALPFDDVVPTNQATTTVELIEFWRGRVEREPQDFISMTYLGQAFMRRARESGDVADYERAEAVLRKANDIAPTYEPTLAYVAAVRYAKHDFVGALQLAQQVYASNPQALQALATIGDAQLELGNYPEAESAYQTLLDSSPSAPVYARVARLAWLNGNLAEAFAQMQRAVEYADKLGLTGESAAWYQVQLGELSFNTGRLDEAATNYAHALDTYPNYYLALGGLAKVRAAQGNYADAIALYERAVAIIPQPDLLAALGDVYALTGQSDQAQKQYDTVEFIGKLAAINRVIYNRQLALFYANHDLHLDTALEQSTGELANRKDIYAYDAAAWAYYKVGRYAEAADAMQQAQRLGTRDALLYYHAGMIQSALGNRSMAKTLLREALSINPNFDLRQAEAARAELARLEGQG